VSKSGEDVEGAWEKPLWRQRMMAAAGWPAPRFLPTRGLPRGRRISANVGLHNRYQLAYTWAVFSNSE